MGMLLKAGANPNVVDKDGYTALMYAAQKVDLKNHKILAMLLMKGADVHVKNRFGYTALHFAAENPWSKVDNKVILTLSALSASPNWQNKFNQTPLERACVYGNYVAVAALIQNCPTLMTLSNCMLLARHQGVRNLAATSLKKRLKAQANEHLEGIFKGFNGNFKIRLAVKPLSNFKDTGNQLDYEYIKGI